MKYNHLTAAEKHIIEEKGTEAPFSGEYDDFYVPGTFICRRCNLPLFSSKAKLMPIAAGRHLMTISPVL